MSLTLIITGLVLVVVGFSIKPSRKQTEPAKAEAKPKSNDKRIVQRPDGDFEIEYFFEHPAWHTLVGRLKTLDEAKQRLKVIEGPMNPKLFIPKRT